MRGAAGTPEPAPPDKTRPTRARHAVQQPPAARDLVRFYQEKQDVSPRVGAWASTAYTAKLREIGSPRIPKASPAEGLAVNHPNAS